MAMLANRSPAGFCLCKRCVKPDERREIRNRNRRRENRQWRQDARDLDQGHAWQQAELDEEGIGHLPYWEALDAYEAMWA